MNKCNFCGNKNLSPKMVDYIYRHKEHYMLFQNVPAEVCDYCGERYYKAAVLKSIEHDFFEIQNHRKEPVRSIIMPVEEYMAV